MENISRHKTHKRQHDMPVEETQISEQQVQTLPQQQSKQSPVILNTTVNEERFRNLLDESAKEAYSRPWHRLERGLRLNRLRLYVEEIAPQCSFTPQEKEGFFGYLQRALDKKLLNTHKIVNYSQERQKIEKIIGLEVRRSVDGQARWGFTVKKTKSDATRKKKKEGEPDKIDTQSPPQISQIFTQQ
jgi:hypothetical protein